MRSTPFLILADRRHASQARRMMGFLLVLAVHALLLVLVFRPWATPPAIPPSAAKTFGLLSISDEDAPKPAKQTQPEKKARVAQARAPRPVPATPPPVPHPVPLKMLILSSEEFAAADISKLGTRGKSQTDDQDASDQAVDGGSGKGTGSGPGGERLYNADWYTKPTDAELDYYLPSRARQPGWAMIACRTIPNYRVEDCHELDEYPAGSGLSRALRQAAWQFRVRPPRIGGKTLVGAWVRIRFDFTEAERK